MEECIEVVGDVLVEAVERAALFVGGRAVAAEGCQQAGGKRSIDFFEQFRESHADRIAPVHQAVAAELGIFSARPLAEVWPDRNAEIPANSRPESPRVLAGQVHEDRRW